MEPSCSEVSADLSSMTYTSSVGTESVLLGTQISVTIAAVGLVMMRSEYMS